MTWEFSLTGLLIGGLVGLTGMGGGSLMTPVLVVFFGFKPTYAIGTDILHGAIFKTVGAIRHRRLGNVRARLSGWMFIASAPMSLLGVATATWLRDRYGDGLESVMGRVLGAALIAGGIGVLAKNFVGYRPANDAFRLTNRDRLLAVFIGFFGGFIVGLTSVGSGVFFGLTMLLAFPLQSAKVVGTDIFHAAALLWVAGSGHLLAGNVDVHAVAWLLVGSIPGVFITSRFTVRVPDRGLRSLLALVLLVSGIKLVEPPGGTLVLIAALVACVAIVSVLAHQAWMRRREPTIG